MKRKGMMIKKQKKSLLLMGLLLSGCLMFTGCGSKMEDAAYESSTEASYYSDEAGDYQFGVNSHQNAEGEDYYEDADVAMESTEVSKDVSSNTASKKVNSDKKKIIKTYNYTYDTEDFDNAYSYLRDRIAQYDGYVSSSDLYGTDRRHLSLTARIPAEKCDEFVSQLGEVGTIVTQSESAEDVTLQYSDVESHITALKTEQERINELVKDAEDLDTIIELEDRLTDIRYELESYQSQKNLYDDLVSYCTVNINMDEVSYTVPVDDSSVFSRIKTGLETSFRDITYGLTNFFVWFIVKLPYLLLWALIIYIIYRIVRRIIRKSKEKYQLKKAKKLAQAAANPQTMQGQRPVNPQVMQGQRPVNPQVMQGQRPVNPQAMQGQPVNPQTTQGQPVNPQTTKGQQENSQNAQDGQIIKSEDEKKNTKKKK